MFLNDAQILAALAAQMKQVDPGTGASLLPAYWNGIVATQHAKAYNEIVTKLAERGYNAAQIAAWDRGAEYETDLALYWCLTIGAGLSSANDQFIKQLDRREDLIKVSVTNSSVLVNPGTAGKVGFGVIDDSRDTFRYKVVGPGNGCDDPPEVRKTRW